MCSFSANQLLCLHNSGISPKITSFKFSFGMCLFLSRDHASTRLTFTTFHNLHNFIHYYTKPLKKKISRIHCKPGLDDSILTQVQLAHFKYAPISEKTSTIPALVFRGCLAYFNVIISQLLIQATLTRSTYKEKALRHLAKTAV